GPFFIPSEKGYKGLGRLNAIGFHPTDSKTVFVGAPAGGLWASNDNGQTWHSETDVLPTLGVSAILVDHTNPEVMYIGTGDRDAGDAPGLGVMKSYDGGLTWEMANTGIETRIVGRLIMHPSDHNMLFAATNSGIFKSTDAGENWVTKEGGNFKEVIFKTDDPTVVFASGNGKFFRSVDTGETWEENIFLPNADRGVIGVSPANPDVVYILLTAGSVYTGIYRSDDAGRNFTEMSTTPNIMSWGCEGGDGGQAWYDLDVAIDPTNEDIIFAGGVNCFKSIDGGITWDISSHWWGDCTVPSVHADLHVLEYNPVDGKLYAGNDGGVYWTDDGGTSWHEISNGLSIGQVYKIGQSATEKNKVINGYQDNGTSTYMGSPTFVNNLGGDGMECAVDYENELISYGSLYYGAIHRMVNNSSSFKIAGEGTFGITESGGWITPFLIHKGNTDEMFIGFKNIWKGTGIKTGNPSWMKISDGLAGNNGTNMRDLEQSPANLNILYAGRDDKKLFRTDRCNDWIPQWTDLMSNLPENTSINDLEAHPFDENIIYMAQGNNVYKSVDKGESWEMITGSLPNVSKNDIAYYKNSQEGLYLATDIGIFYTDTFLGDWIMFDNGFPVSSKVTEVEIYYDPDNPENDAIHAATYGRGLWESDMYHSTPIADFVADQALIPPSCPVSFSDLSSGVPTSWEWTFEGGNPGTSNEPNPGQVIFANADAFDVTLTVTNEIGTDTRVYENMITVDDDLLPDVDFEADKIATCTGTPVYFADLTQYCPESWEWDFTPDDVICLEGTDQYSQNPVVQFESNGSYGVELTSTNVVGSSTQYKAGFIHAGGIPAPFAESFEAGSFHENGWTVVNPDGSITWEIVSPTCTPGGNNAVMMNCRDYYALGQRDQLISPVFNFTDAISPGLLFKYAYAQRANQIDSLIVKISYDCGENWERVYANGPDGNGCFETALPTSSYFDPLSAEDWCGSGYGAGCPEFIPFINLSPNTLVMFESYSKFGNNLYIDEIEITTLVGQAEIPLSESNMRISPNPADGEFTLKLNNPVPEVNVLIRNIHGQVVKSINLSCNSETCINTIAVDDLPDGIYLVQVSVKNFNASEILIVR
nr:PKD domain-containing protein [Bacteroidota bacterium]